MQSPNLGRPGASVYVYICMMRNVPMRVQTHIGMWAHIWIWRRHKQVLAYVHVWARSLPTLVTSIGMRSCLYPRGINRREFDSHNCVVAMVCYQQPSCLSQRRTNTLSVLAHAHYACRHARACKQKFLLTFKIKGKAARIDKIAAVGF